MEIRELAISEDIKIVKFVAKRGKKMRVNSILFKYTTSDKGHDKLKDYRCKIFQTVVDICVELGDVPKDTVIMKCKEGCGHPIVAFSLCADCGKDLINEDSAKLQDSVSMLHALPEIAVSASEAAELGMSDILHQLKQKKLTLIVDLDQTLIHTSTTDTIPQGIQGIFHFTLSNKKFRYSTRLRPGTEKFLSDMSKLYEMHVFTMGARDYAHTISKVLDPDRKYFSSRILSRDECFDNHSKVPKLSALFPKGDQLVVIIDDRFDMWTNCQNLIRVHPYNFFEDVGDINDPDKRLRGRRNVPNHGHPELAQFTKNKPLDDKQTSFCFRTAQNNLKCVISLPLTSDKEADYTQIFHNLRSFLLDGNFELSLLHLDHISQKINSPQDSTKTDKLDDETPMESDESNGTPLKTSETKKPEPSEDEIKFRSIIESLCKASDVPSALSEFYMKYIENGREREEERRQLLLLSPLYQHYSGKAESDGDRYLESLAVILKKIHEEFYKAYIPTEEVEKLPSTKVIIPGLRRVLAGCHVVFSGIIPTNIPSPQCHPIWCAALQMGATVSMTLRKTGDTKTTHLVTARADTGKVHQALKLAISIVTEGWLWKCFEIWVNVPTEIYEWKGLTGGKRVKSKSPEPILAALNVELKNTLGDSVLEAMENEVDEALATASDYSSPTDSEDSEAESLDSNELTGPPCETRKRTRSEIDEEEEEVLLDPLFGNKEINDEEDDYVSEDSMEGELVDELDAEMSEHLKNVAEGQWK